MNTAHLASPYRLHMGIVRKERSGGFLLLGTPRTALISAY
jgi:hypothetical protein